MQPAPAPGKRVLVIDDEESLRDLLQTCISAFCYHPALYHGVGRYVVYLAFKLGLFRRSTPDAEYSGVIGSGFMARMAPARVSPTRWPRASGA